MVQDATDETTFTEKPSAAASWGKESSLESESFPASDGNMNVEKEVASTPELAPTNVPPQNPSEDPIRNGTEVSAIDSSSKPSSDAKSGVISSVSATKASERLVGLPFELSGWVSWSMLGSIHVRYLMPFKLCSGRKCSLK